MTIRERPAPAPAVGEVAAPVMVARQPILDRGERIVGYEILYRPMPASLEDSQAASASVIVRALADIGLARLTGAQAAHINVTREFLLTVRPLPLPPERIVLELTDDRPVDGALLEVLRELVDAGFRIALEDVSWRADRGALLGLASAVKLDIRALEGRALINAVARLRERDMQLVAEKVETREDYAVCRALGFDAFQGYFFARPDLVAGQAAPTHRLGTLAALSGPAARASFEELERVILQDAGLSHKLLRLANSASIAARHEVASVHQALTLLGTVAVRRWALLLTLAVLTDRRHHVLETGLQRARLCELLARRDGADAAPERAFTVGLFSILDALLGAPLPELLQELPFDARTQRALACHEGPEGRLLAGVLAYERGDFDAHPARTLDLLACAHAYRNALDWAQQTARHMT